MKADAINHKIHISSVSSLLIRKLRIILFSKFSKTGMTCRFSNYSLFCQCHHKISNKNPVHPGTSIHAFLQTSSEHILREYHQTN